MEKLKKVWEFIKSIEIVRIVIEWLKTNEGILLSLLLFFPLGLFLLWRYGNYKQYTKVLSTIVLLCAFVIVCILGVKSVQYKALVPEYNELKNKNEDIELKNINVEVELKDANAKLEEKEMAFEIYQEKMKPYEAMSEADAKKAKVDTDAANNVSEKIKGLPTIDELKLDDKDKITNVQQSYDALTDEQKKLVDISSINELNDKLKELEETAQKEAEQAAKEKAQKEKEEKEAAEAEKKRKEEEAAAEQKRKDEEAKGYETGITYDQLARTPDDYDYKKVKFYGKVIQVIEGDDTTEIRFAVDDDYNQVIYCDFDSSIVSSRVLEDDYITIYGKSTNLLSYQSTMGGTITIPSVTVDKIDQ